MAFGPADPTHYMLLITGFALEHAVAVPRDGTFTMRGSIEVEAAVLTTVCLRCGQLLLYPDTGAPPVVVDAARDAQWVGRCGPSAAAAGQLALCVRAAVRVVSALTRATRGYAVATPFSPQTGPVRRMASLAQHANACNGQPVGTSHGALRKPPSGMLEPRIPKACEVNGVSQPTWSGLERA